MTAPIAGIDPHQAQFTVGIVDATGVERACATYPNTAAGFVAAIDLLITHGVDQVGIKGSASWGAHVAIAVVAAGFDAREVPAQRSAIHRRSRRLAKTDVVDAVAAARALLAEPSLGPVQTLVVYDPLVARARSYPGAPRALVEARTLLLHHVGDQLAKLPTDVRDQLPATGKLSHVYASWKPSTRRTSPRARERTACRGCSRSSTRTARLADRSVRWSVALTSCSTLMARRCVTSPASYRSPPRR